VEDMCYERRRAEVIYDLGLRSLVFHGNVGIRHALRCCQQDARRPSRRSLSRFPSLTPTMQTEQDSRKGPDTKHASGLSRWVLVPKP